jgi:hypothetical protein
MVLRHPAVFEGDSKAPEFGEDYERNITPPYTEEVDLLTYQDDSWRINRIKVPQEPGVKAYICFPVKGKASLECLYRGIDNPDRVDMEVVIPRYDEL